SLSELWYEGIMPMPLFSAVTTRSAVGCSSSRTGPTAPVVAASFSVWQVPQGGIAPTVNKVLPSWSSLASPSSAPRAAPGATSASAAPQAAASARRTAGGTVASGDRQQHRRILPAVVAVAVRVLEALLGLDVAGGVGRATDEDVVAGAHAQRHRELPPREAAEVEADERRVDPVAAAVARDLDAADRLAAAERNAGDVDDAGLDLVLAGGRRDERLDVELLDRRLARLRLPAERRHPVASLLDLRERLARRERDALDVLDVVDAVVAGDDEAQRPAVRERERRAVHLPREQRVVHHLDRDRALDDDRERIDVVGKLLAAGAGEPVHPRRDAAERLDDEAQRDAAPEHE